MTQLNRIHLEAWESTLRAAIESESDPDASSGRLRTRLRSTSAALRDAIHALRRTAAGHETAQQAENVQTQRLAELLLHLPIAYLRTTTDAFILQANPAAAMLNLSARALLGRNLLLFVDERVEWMRMIGTVRGDGSSLRHVALRGSDRDIFGWVRASPLDADETGNRFPRRIDVPRCTAGHERDALTLSRSRTTPRRDESFATHDQFRIRDGGCRVALSVVRRMYAQSGDMELFGVRRVRYRARDGNAGQANASRTRCAGFAGSETHRIADSARGTKTADAEGRRHGRAEKARSIDRA